MIGWPLPVSMGGMEGAARPTGATLRVSLNLIAEAHASPGPTAIPAATLSEATAAPGSPEKIAGASGATDATQNAISLLGYYPASRLSRMPAAISLFDIQSPAGGDPGVGGKLTIRVWIGVNGGVDDLRILSSGLPAAYERAALAAFEKMRFAPGQIDGMAVGSWADIVIEYADFQR